MPALIIPEDAPGKEWPSLAPDIIDFIEARCVYGPGDLQGQPYKVDGDFEYVIWRAYEIHPRGHVLAGRRRFSEVVEDVRKGVGKTEHAAILAICESHPECPVRFDGWRKVGRNAWEPVGRPQVAPYIPMLAYTEEQSEDLAYAALSHIITSSDLVEAYDVGLDRILVIGEDGRAAGKIAALAAAPDARDGARTTWQHLDETHRMFSPRHRRAWTTMRENANKRRTAEAWTFKTTTAPEAGQQSIAEDDRRMADKVAAGDRRPPERLFYFRRSADPALEIPAADEDTPANRDLVRAAVLEASGPAGEWSGDIDGIVSSFFDARADRAYLCRVWLNIMGEGSDSAFNAAAYAKLIRPPIEPGALVVASFDGSTGGKRSPDWTGLMVTEVATGTQQVVARWHRPEHLDPSEDWEVPRHEVDAAVAATFDLFAVWRLYGDPHRWRHYLDAWAGLYGADRVVAWDTSKWARMAWAVRDLAEAIRTGAVGHTGDPDLITHVGNARRRYVPIFTEDTREKDGEQLYTIAKDRADSPRKIDLAVCAVLGRVGQLDAMRAGITADDLGDADRTLYTWT